MQAQSTRTCMYSNDVSDALCWADREWATVYMPTRGPAQILIARVIIILIQIGESLIMPPMA